MATMAGGVGRLSFGMHVRVLTAVAVVAHAASYIYSSTSGAMGLWYFGVPLARFAHVREHGSGLELTPHPLEPSPAAKEPEGAVVIVEPQTGYVKALVGGSDFARSEFNRAILARRQAGSAFKPFVYLAALEAGFKPGDVLDDSPLGRLSADVYKLQREAQLACGPDRFF